MTEDQSRALTTWVQSQVMQALQTLPPNPGLPQHQALRVLGHRLIDEGDTMDMHTRIRAEVAAE